MTAPSPRTTPAGVAPTAPRVELGLFDTITESIFGQPDPDTWRPLLLSTFFSEGWNEAWVPSPNGSGGAPRQGWINAQDGNLYRLWFFTFAQGFNQAPKGNAYLGAYTIFTPLSRRLDADHQHPLRAPQQCRHRLAHHRPEPADDADDAEPLGIRRYLVHAPLLAARDEGLLAHGRTRCGDPDRHPAPCGENNHPGPGLRLLEQLRGRLGDPGRARSRIPMNGSGDNLINQLAIGQTLTDHDVPLFGDFTYYLSTVVNTPLRRRYQTSVTLTPGMRTHLGNDWYFLAGLPTPVTNDRVADIGMIFWFMKAW